MSTKALLTADELEQMPDDDSVQIELDEGELIRMPPAGLDHGDLGAEITMLLRAYAKKHRLGRVVNADTGFRLAQDIVRAPDIAFIRADRWETVKSRGFAKGAPDLAVEIFSPSDSVRQLMRKVKQYFAAGTHTVWIVYEERREIHVLDKNGTDKILTDGDTLDCAELLPGFSVAVADIFQ